MHNKASETGYTTPYKFTGKELDPETGLYYYGARYYDPVLSRWISTDPPISTGEYLPTGNRDRDANLPGMGGVYRSINLDAYSYGGHSPVIIVDPDGREDIIIIQNPHLNGRLESQAFVFPNGTLDEKNVASLMLAYKLYGNTITPEVLVRSTIGSDYIRFDNFTSLPDSTTEYGTVAAGKVYNYEKSKWTPSNAKFAFRLSDPGLGWNKVPQDKNFGRNMGKGKNPAHPERDPGHLEGAHLHRAYNDPIKGIHGSEGCPMQLGFDEPGGPGNPGGLGNYLNNSPTGDSGRVLILRDR